MIPNIIFVLDDLFQNIFTDNTFTIFTLTSNKLYITCDTYDTFEAIITYNGNDYKLSELKLYSDIIINESISTLSSQ